MQWGYRKKTQVSVCVWGWKDQIWHQGWIKRHTDLLCNSNTPTPTWRSSPARPSCELLFTRAAGDRERNSCSRVWCDSVCTVCFNVLILCVCTVCLYYVLVLCVCTMRSYYAFVLCISMCLNYGYMCFYYVFVLVCSMVLCVCTMCLYYATMCLYYATTCLYPRIPGGSRGALPPGPGQEATKT
jgi:hypothetical protein